MTWRRIGPGLAVAAAFVGPGTVTTVTVAGARYGFTLLWAVLAGLLVTLVLQEAAVRLTVITGQPLGTLLRTRFTPHPLLKRVLAFLVLGGVVAGAAAFQVGNLLGATLGLTLLWNAPAPLYVVLLADLAFLLLWFGAHQRAERVLVLLVATMTLAFLATALLHPPPLDAVAASLLPPTLPAGGDLLVLALLGTTVVPYNLFLHSALVEGHGWRGARDLPAMRWDLAAMVLAGGAASLAILATSATLLQGVEVTSAAAMAVQLRPVTGPLAGDLFALGLAAAGFTSSVTAPMAAAYAAGHILGWEGDLATPRYRTTWILVLVSGALLAALAVEPVAAIVAAQALNGLLLPLLAAVLLWGINRTDLLGEHRNRVLGNLAGGAALLLTLVLGLRLLWGAL